MVTLSLIIFSVQSPLNRPTVRVAHPHTAPVELALEAVCIAQVLSELDMLTNAKLIRKKKMWGHLESP